MGQSGISLWGAISRLRWQGSCTGQLRTISGHGDGTLLPRCSHGHVSALRPPAVCGPGGRGFEALARPSKARLPFLAAPMADPFGERPTPQRPHDNERVNGIGVPVALPGCGRGGRGFESPRSPLTCLQMDGSQTVAAFAP